MVAPIPTLAAPAELSRAPQPAPVAGRTAEQFEAFFLSSIMENLFTGVGSDSLFGGGPSEGVYRSMLLQEYGKVAARGGGIGIADAVQREMVRMQEAAR
jgi:Rod binding domain-containing protein